VVSLTGWGLVAGWRADFSWRQVVSGLDQIAWGMVFFVRAALIGVTKTGARGKWLPRREGQGSRSLG
jgi:hypothetical protein